MFRQFFENRIYKKKNGYYCNLCENFLQTKDDVLNHLDFTNLHHHTLKRAKCHELEKQFQTLSERNLRKLVENYILVIQPHKYRCYICHSEIQYVDNVFGHIKQTDHVVKMNRYRVHGKNREKNLQQHILKRNPEVKQNKQRSGCLDCKICNIKIDCEITLMDHLKGKKHFKNLKLSYKTVADKSTKSGAVARSIFISPTSLDQSGSTSTSPIYTCFFCDSTFSIENELVGHFFTPMNGCLSSEFIKKKIRKKSTSFSCILCNFELYTTMELVTHTQAKKHRSKANKKRIKLQSVSEHDPMITCNPIPECNSNTKLVNAVVQASELAQNISNFPVYTCFLCDTTFPDRYVTVQHFIEPKNGCSISSVFKPDELGTDNFKCDLCLKNISNDAVSLIQHTQGKSHKGNAKWMREQLQLLPKHYPMTTYNRIPEFNLNRKCVDAIDNSTKAHEPVENISNLTVYNCFLCDSTFPDEDTTVQHFMNPDNGCLISSSLKPNKFNKRILSCDLCSVNILNETVPLIQHTQSSNHKRNAKKKGKSHLNFSEYDTTRECNSIPECNPSTKCIKAVDNTKAYEPAQNLLKLSVYNCFLCDSTFPDQDTIVQHFTEPENNCSISSLLKLDPSKESFRCDLCLLDVSKHMACLIQHTQGKKHRENAMMERVKLEQNALKHDSVAPSNPNTRFVDTIGTKTFEPTQNLLKLSVYNCFLCDSTFPDQDTIVQHFTEPENNCSISSLLKLDPSKENFRCNLCLLDVSKHMACLIQHTQGRRHRNNAELRREKLQLNPFDYDPTKCISNSECNSTTKCVYTCFFCESVFSNRDTIAQHFFNSGKCVAPWFIKKHEIIDNQVVFNCDLCPTALYKTFGDLLVHTEGEKHRNNATRERERENSESNIISCSSIAEGTNNAHCKSNQKCDEYGGLVQDDTSSSTYICLFNKFDFLLQGKEHKINVEERRKTHSFEVSKEMPEHKENLKESILYKRDISERLMNISNINYPYYCSICHMTVSSDKKLFKHLNGFQHADLVSELPKGSKIVIYCRVCYVRILGDESIMNHLDSNEHKRKLFTHIANSDDSKYNVACVNLDPGSNTEVCNQISEMQNKPSRQSRKPKRTNTFKDQGMISHLESYGHKKKFFYLSAESDSKTGSENDANQLNFISESKNLLDELCFEEKRKIRWRNTDIKKKAESSPHFNKNYCRVFLESGSSNIFDIDQVKIEELKTGIGLSFLLDDKRVCLACNQQMPNNLQLLYEHLSKVSHLRKLDQLMIDDLEFEQFRDQFSNLALAKEFMIEVTDDVAFCFACKTEINNDDNIIRNHVENDDHKVQSQEQKELSQEIFKIFTEQLSNAWYIVQRFWCQLCNAKFEYDIDFAEHLEGSKHSKMVKKMASKGIDIWNDICIPCGSISLGQPDTYMKHCDDKMHKYLVKSKDYAVPEMIKPAKNLLKNVEEVAESLVLKSDAGTFLEEKFGLVLQRLEEAVKLHYPEAKAYVFGSRASNLAFPDSDVDIFLDCGHAYNGTQLLSKTREYLLNSQLCLESQPSEWDVKEVLLKVRAPIIRVWHRELELNCDVSFTSGLTVEKTKIVRLFMVSFPPCRKMVLYLKKWLNSCLLTDSQGLTTFGITWLVIFYLQQINVFPSIVELMRNKSQSKIISGWETGIDEKLSVKHCSLEFKELLKGFFEFYANYNYRSCVIAPLMGKSLNKQDFTDDHIDHLPQEMRSYICSIKSTPKPEIFRIDSPLCVQDPIDLLQNITRSVSKLTLRSFKEYCQTSAEILSNL